MRDEENFTHEEKQLICTMAEIWFDDMSLLDRHESSLVAMPDTEEDSGGIMMTTPGSPNDAFWSKLVALEWAAKTPEDSGMMESFVAFSLNDRGTKMLPKFLQVVA